MDRMRLVGQLERRQAELRAIYEGIPAAEMRQPLNGGWTPLQILGHLKDSIAINEQRLQRMVVEDEPRIRSWNQDETAADADYNSQDPGRLLEQVAVSGAAVVALLRNLDHERWLRVGIHENPDWGRITIEFLANHLLEHEQEHLADLRRAFKGEEE